MTVTFCKAKQGIDSKKTPAVCNLYEARASVIQEYNHEQQLKLKEGLVLNKPTCAFAQILMNSSAEHLITTPFGAVPKGKVLSYQSLEYEPVTRRERLEPAKTVLPCLPLDILNNAPCVYTISHD